jgi:hypothetical protein
MMEMKICIYTVCMLIISGINYVKDLCFMHECTFVQLYIGCKLPCFTVSIVKVIETLMMSVLITSLWIDKTRYEYLHNGNMNNSYECAQW